jgi:hypothetical protein
MPRTFSTMRQCEIICQKIRGESMADIGTLLFVLALVLTFFVPASFRPQLDLPQRCSVCRSIASLLLQSPLPRYSHADTFKVQPAPGFHWHTWPVTALLGVAVAVYACIRRLSTSGPMQNPAASENALT